MAAVPRGTAKRCSRAKTLGPRAQVHCTTWYSLPYGTYPEGPRRGCTVPWRTLRGTGGTLYKTFSLPSETADGRLDQSTLGREYEQAWAVPCFLARPPILASSSPTKPRNGG